MRKEDVLRTVSEADPPIPAAFQSLRFTLLPHCRVEVAGAFIASRAFVDYVRLRLENALAHRACGASMHPCDCDLLESELACIERDISAHLGDSPAGTVFRLLMASREQALEKIRRLVEKGW
ncbi:MAG: hypothetical protein PHW10_03630 [Candidatus Peribacteraceae bacterium]|nr:hypothetical protein [Candidatus Peribacteraceae bacterium]